MTTLKSKNKISIFFIFMTFKIFSGSPLLAYNLHEYAKDIESLSPKEKERFLTNANKLKCPTCTGLSVLGSDAAFSMQIRKKVMELVKEKKDDQQIKSFFTERYGLWILRAPPKEGFHLILWLIPIAMFLGIFIFGLFLLKKSQEKNEKNQTQNFDRDLSLLKDYRNI